MTSKKNMREKGKLPFRRMFQELKQGDRVCIVKEGSTPSYFPSRIYGRTGIITGKRGASYLIKMKDCNAEKTYIISPIHLKKLK